MPGHSPEPDALRGLVAGPPRRGLHGGTHLSLERLNAEQAALMVLACDPDAGRDQVARVQRAAEGVPLLIEEVLASPGVPDSFADTVRERSVSSRRRNEP